MIEKHPHIVEIIGEDGLPAFKLRNDFGDYLTLYRKGAHITSWVKADVGEILFLSKASGYSTKPIRGGIPIIFPQFGGRPIGDFPKLPFHGFARDVDWVVQESSVRKGVPSLILRLSANEQTSPLWPVQFEVLLKITLSQELKLTLIVRNQGETPLLFTGGFHPYFRVSHISASSVSGLQSLNYEDAFQDFQLRHQEEESLTFLEPANRVYLSPPQELKLRDMGLAHALLIEQNNFPEVVVWRAAPEYSKEKDDLTEEDYQNFVCIEPAACSTRITVPRGGEWLGDMIVRAIPVEASPS